MATKKRITELTVAELRVQLGKRGMEADGDRAALIAKLKKALQEENAKSAAGAGQKSVTPAAGERTQPQTGTGSATAASGDTSNKLKSEEANKDGVNVDEGSKKPDNDLTEPAERPSAVALRVAAAASDVVTPTAAVSSAPASVVTPTTVVASSSVAATPSATATPSTPATSTPSTPSVLVTPSSGVRTVPGVALTSTPLSAAAASPQISAAATPPSSSAQVSAAVASSTSATPGQTTQVSAGQTPPASAIVQSQTTSVVQAATVSTSDSTGTSVSPSVTRPLTQTTPASAITSTISSPSVAVTAQASAVVSTLSTVSTTSLVTATVTQTSSSSAGISAEIPATATPVLAKKVASTPTTVSSAGTERTAILSTGSAGVVSTAKQAGSTPVVGKKVVGTPSVSTAVTNKTGTIKPSGPAAKKLQQVAGQSAGAGKTEASSGQKATTPKADVGNVEPLVVKKEKEDIVDLTLDEPSNTEKVGTEQTATAKLPASSKTGSEAHVSSTTDVGSAGHSLWVTGLSSSFRATELKQLFSAYGKVIGAKVVTSAKCPGSKCFGFVAMSTVDDAENAMKQLNNTEVQGQKITVEKDLQKRAIVQTPSVPTPSVPTPSVPTPSVATPPVPTPATATLWVNGLSTTTKAAELKILFMKYGKVTGAKVVTSAKNPGSKCYGLVTMSTVQEADTCIKHLNKTEFGGRIISLEKTDLKTPIQSAAKPSTTTTTDSSKGAKLPEKKDDAKTKTPQEIKSTAKKKKVPTATLR